MINFLFGRNNGMVDLKKRNEEPFARYNEEEEKPEYEVNLTGTQLLLDEIQNKIGSIHYFAKVKEASSDTERVSEGDIVVFHNNRVKTFDLPFGTYKILNEEDVLLIFEEV